MKFFVCILLSCVFISCSNESRIEAWQDGIIPFYLSGNFSETDIQNLYEGMEKWENVCGVIFREVNYKNASYQIIKTDDFKWSSTVGSNNAFSHMNFGLSFNPMIQILHELGHCIGLVHEHQRPDRDGYVSIMWQNILRGYEHNFYIKDNPLLEEVNFEYDFNSIMHYQSHNWSSNGMDTITSFDDQYLGPLGIITEVDLEKARKIYGPPKE